jgi:N-formylglutamate deformylase
MSFVIEDVLVRDDPAGARLPLVFDSPHSGSAYPPDFGFVCPLPLLRQAEDAHVDTLFGAAPDFGATLISALFPRSYIDPNRAPDDIEPGLIAGPWPEPLRPGDKSAAGLGLIRRLCAPGVPMYDGKLTVAQVAERIDRYWRPYHAELAAALDGLHAFHGVVWHVDCHSMPCFTIGGAPVDIVLGNRDGTSCEPGFLAFAAAVLRERGYRVRINDPYKGVEILRRYGDPARRRHSMQLEIGRHLYMNEETLERTAGFDRLQADLTGLIARLASYVGGRVSQLAAE